MSEVYWASGNRPALGSMALTTQLTDNSPGDTMSGETVSSTSSYGIGCAYNTSAAAMTVEWVNSCPYALTGFSATFNRANSIVTYGGAICLAEDDTSAGSVYTAEAEYSLDGASWTTITLGTVPEDGTITATFSGSAKYCRLILTASNELYNASVDMTSAITVTDFRVSGSLLAPGAPTLTGPSICEGTQNTLTWASVSCATSYEVSIDSGTAFSVGGDLSYVDTPVTIGVAKSYRVRARNSGGVSAWSNTVSVTACVVAAVPSPAPAVRVMGVCEGEQVTLWIDASPAATSYKLYRTDTTGVGFLIKTFTTRPTAEAPYIDTPRGIGVTVSYYAIATNGIGDSTASESVEATPCLNVCAKTVWTQERCC
jgi:hypothetical protein